MARRQSSIFLTAAFLAMAIALCVAQTSYTEAELAQMRQSGEKHKFQAEVDQLMDILVNSLYSNKDVFLRELISNGSDALDKIRFASLTNQDLLADKADLDIRIQADESARTLSIIDSGIGMTKDDLVNLLGTIAQSGTKAFLKEALAQQDASNLIGQFGVGFYSAFLVADTVRVTTKNPNDPVQWVWESAADGSFTVTADPQGNTLGRGTQVTLLLKEEMSEYLTEEKLEQLIHTYSEFITFPIYLWTVREEERTIEKPAAAEPVEGLDVEEEEEDEDADEDDEPETELVEIWGWERLNEIRPIWTRDPADITDADYNAFYKAISDDYTAPLAHVHFTAEGDVNFRSILYVPATAPQNLYQGAGAGDKKPLKLYVKRVFITDNFDSLMPKYLQFIQGVVDSDDLDLNVSREMLQQSKTLGIIQKKLVRKAIAMFQELAENKPEEYSKFFSIFGTNIKWGALEDRQNKARLEKLMRFSSSTVEGLTSFDDYISRMKEGQDQIYFLAGNDRASLENSPLLENLASRGYEVLYMIEPIDEYVTQSLTKYGDFALANVAKEGLKFDDEDDDDDDDEQADLTEVISYLKSTLGSSKVASVVVSKRLAKSPSALVSGSYGWTANMERIAKAQALSDKGMAQAYKARRVLEINPTHPVVVQLAERVAANQEDPVSADIAQLIYHSALLTSGFEIEDPHQLSRHLQHLMEVLIVPAAGASQQPLKDEL